MVSGPTVRPIIDRVTGMHSICFAVLLEPIITSQTFTFSSIFGVSNRTCYVKILPITIELGEGKVGREEEEKGFIVHQKTHHGMQQGIFKICSVVAQSWHTLGQESICLS